MLWNMEIPNFEVVSYENTSSCWSLFSFSVLYKADKIIQTLEYILVKNCPLSFLISTYVSIHFSKFAFTSRESLCMENVYRSLKQFLFFAPLNFQFYNFQAGAELQQRSSKILEERSTKRLLEVGNLYHSFTTLGLEPVSIIHYTRPGSSIKRPTPN